MDTDRFYIPPSQEQIERIQGLVIEYVNSEEGKKVMRDAAKKADALYNALVAWRKQVSPELLLHPMDV